MVAIPTASATFLTGIVKAVPSGDTIVVMNAAAPKTGPPPEMRLTLASLKAPLLSRDGLSDEPYAWASREWLRNRLIGQRVTFRMDYQVANLSRNFATVMHPSSSVSINQEAVAAGASRVRHPQSDNEKCSPEFEALCAAEEKAASARAGLHAGGNAPITRRLPAAGDSAVDPEMLLSTCKGRPIEGIVEYVANGSAMKVLLKEVPHGPDSGLRDLLLTVCLSGVQSPGFRRPEGAASTVQPVPMPFAVNAKFLTEIRMLNRNVNVYLEGVDRNGLLFATIEDPKAQMYIGEELLKAGFAKTVSWSIDLSPRAPALRAAERSARDRQMGVWKGFKAPTTNPELFTGKCVEVISGDLIAVLDYNTGTVRRISLASVRANRADRGTRDRTTMPTGPVADAKEALRKKLIGRKVRVKVEYTRAPSEESVRKEVMVFATVGREGDKKNPDVALPMISNGLLAVVRHRGEEDRAANYEEYLERQKAAMDTRKGIHGENTSGSIRINNLTGPDAKKRSRDVLSGLQRNGPYKAVVEYVSSASRYRLFLPSESMLLTLALRAVRCPQSTRRVYAPDGSVREEQPGEPHGDEAADFAKENFMQRDVEVEIHNVDRVGAFLGNMYMVDGSGERQDISASLLSHGHGYLHESFDPSRDLHGSKYLAIENTAKTAKKGVWSDYVEPSAEENSSPTNQNGVRKTFVGTVCEIGFGGRMFVQNRDTCKAALASVEAGLGSLSLDSAQPAPLAGLKPGAVVAAKFSADNRWYRAKVLAVQRDSGVDVRFIDYGNEERVVANDVRRFGVVSGFVSAAPIAIEVGLDHIVVPGADDPCGVAAGEYLRDCVYGKDVTVSVIAEDGPGKVIGDITIPVAGSSDSASKSISLSEQILQSGLARILRKSDRASKAAYKKLRPFEEVGIASRQYLWNYGDAFDSDCDDE